MSQEYYEVEVIDGEKVGTKGNLLHYQAYNKSPPMKKIKEEILKEENNNPEIVLNNN